MIAVCATIVFVCYCTHTIPYARLSPYYLRGETRVNRQRRLLLCLSQFLTKCDREKYQNVSGVIVFHEICPSRCVCTIVSLFKIHSWWVTKIRLFPANKRCLVNARRPAARLIFRKSVEAKALCVKADAINSFINCRIEWFRWRRAVIHRYVYQSLIRNTGSSTFGIHLFYSSLNISSRQIRVCFPQRTTSRSSYLHSRRPQITA